MGSLTSQLIISLVDKVSGPAKGAAAALKTVAAAEKAVASGGTKNVDGLASSLDRVSKASAKLKASGGLGFDSISKSFASLQLTGRELRSVEKDFARFQQRIASMGREGMRAGSYLPALTQWTTQTAANIKAMRVAADEAEKARAKLYRGWRGGARMAAGALGVGSVAYGAQRMVRGGVTASAVSARESARDYLAGLDQKDSDRLGRAALSSSSRYNSVDASTMHERLRDTSMSMRSIDKAIELADTIAQGTVVLQSLKGKDAAIEEGRKFFSALDTLGKNVEPSEVRSLFDGYIKALGIEGADMNLAGVLQMARQSRSAGGSLSPRFMMTTGVGLQRDMGDNQVGTALASAQSQVIGGRATAKSKEEQRRLGLRDKKGNFLNAKMMMEDPDLYAWGPLKDALKSSGVNTGDNSAVAATLSKIFSNRTVADVFTKLIQQEEQYRAKGGGDVGGFNRGPGLRAAGELPARDPFVAWEGMKAQIANLATQAPIMDAAAKGLSYLSAAIGNFTRQFSEDTDFNKGGKLAGLGVLGVGGAIGGLKAAKAAYGLFTGAGALASSAVALDGSAAALTAAAAKLAGGSLAGDLASKAPTTAKKSIWPKVGQGIAAAAPYGVLAGGAMVPAAVLGGGVYGAAKLFPDDADSAGRRASHGQTVREAYRRRFREDRERTGDFGGGYGSMQTGPAGGNGSDVWNSGTSPIGHLDQSGPAGAAGAKTGASFKQNFESELNGVTTMIQQKVQEWSGILGSFSASPTITPKFGPVPSVGGQKGASLDGARARQQAAQADYGFNTVG